MKVLDARAFNQSINDTEKYLRSLSEQIKQTKAAVNGIISLEDSLKGKAGQAIRSFYQECHLSFLLYFESFIEDYEAILTSIKNQLKNFEPDPNGVISESFLEHDVRSGLNKIETTAIGIVHEANRAMKKVRDIIDLPDLDETHLVESIRQAKRYSNHTIEQLHAFDKAQTAALETVEHDLALMENYINQISSAIKRGEVNLSNYSVKQITSYESYNDLIGDLAQKTNPYENKYRRPDADEQLEVASYIVQSNTLTEEEFESLESSRIKTIHVAVEDSEYDGEYHFYADGMIVREYQDENFNIRYKIVDEIPKVEPKGDVRFLDSPFEGTPLEWAGYAAFPATLVKKGVTKLGKKAITGIEKKVVKEYTEGAGKYNIGTMKHIYHGEINKRGKAVGYHHESMMGGKIIPGTENVPDKNGIYKAKVEIDGVEKVAKSSFFPKEWNRVDVLKAIDEAYQNKKQIGSNKYLGKTSSGIKIEMYLNKDGSIATAYPLYNK